MRALHPALLIVAIMAIACADDVQNLNGGGHLDAAVPSSDASVSVGRDGGTAEDAGPADASAKGASIVAGVYYSCARAADDTVRCWGRNEFGTLGDGTTEPRTAPVTVVGLTGVVELSAGVSHTCARLQDDTVRCWGRNNSGVLGDGTTTLQPTPVAVLALGPVAQVAAGNTHTCARLHDGTVRCWGNNRRGALGNGTTVTSTTPVVVAGLGDVVELASGADFTCARLRDDTIQCWGYIFPDALGGFDADGNVFGVPTPTPMIGLDGVIDIEAGYGHLCGRFANGTVNCVGPNTNGELGDGTNTHRTMPVRVLGLDDAVEVALGGYSCARLRDGTVRCWGSTADGGAAVRGIDNAVAIALGSSHGCARLTDGTIRCWGHNVDRQATPGGCCHDGLCGVPEGTACGDVGVCTDGWCSGCGGTDQPCCDRVNAAGRCRADTPLCTNAEICVACGGIGEPCCGSVDGCADEGAVCFSERCVVAGEPGVPCLPNNECTDGCCTLEEHGSRICVGIGTMCPAPAGAATGMCAVDGSCGTCGGLSQACCPAADSTRIPFYCSAPGTDCAIDVCVEN